MFELTYDILDDLDAIQQKHINLADETDEKLSPRDWYAAAAAAGSNVIFTFEYMYNNDDVELHKYLDALTELKERYFGKYELPDIQMVYSQKYMSEICLKLPDDVQIETNEDFETCIGAEHALSGIPTYYSERDIIFKFPARFETFFYRQKEIEECRKHSLYDSAKELMNRFNYKCSKSIGSLLNFLADLYPLNKRFDIKAEYIINKDTADSSLISYDNAYIIKYTNQEPDKNDIKFMLDEVREIIGSTRDSGIDTNMLYTAFNKWRIRYKRKNV